MILKHKEYDIIDCMTIGVFDSGVGGLWILKNLIIKHPEYNYIFVGDQANIPYGSKTKEEIKNYSEKITEFLINKKSDIIIVACNTASSASLKYLREKFPKTIFIGMEPAIKTAVSNTKTGKIGVWATSLTLQGELYFFLKQKFDKEVEIFENSCQGLVEQIENNNLDGTETRKIIEDALSVMMKEGVDNLVLGCTHYPFTTSLIKEISNNKINIIDPTEAIAKRLGEIIKEHESEFLLEKEVAQREIFTTGNRDKMKSFVDRNLDKKIQVLQLKL